MTLSGFKIFASGITSIPSINSLALHLYKTFGENDWTRVKVAAEAMAPTPKKEKSDNNAPDSLKVK